MSFESVYRSREGTREIQKIADFIGKLVIKNQYEAEAYETTESVSEYYKYYSGGEDWTNPTNYDLVLNTARISKEDCVKIIKEYVKLKIR